VGDHNRNAVPARNQFDRRIEQHSFGASTDRLIGVQE
jgi:hypothetical protein